MAKLYVNHKTAVLDSELDVKELARVAAISPDALSLKDEDGNVYFKVAVSEGKETSVTKNGIVFAKGDNKISLPAFDKVPTVEEVEIKYGAAVHYLNTIAEVIKEEIKDIETAFEGLIVVTGGEE